MLKPFQSFWRDNALNFWTGAKAKPEKLSLLRTRHRTLCLIHFELELLSNESRDAFHHPLTSPLAAHVDIASSRPGESHPQALTDPDLNVSAHPALTVQVVAR